MKKILLILSMITLFSCASTSTSSVTNDYSKLTGTYTFDKAVKLNEKDEDLRIYNTLEEAINGHMYTSNIYPLNTVNGSKVCYSYSQSLKLKRDYTYDYEYKITLTNSEEWGKDFASVEVRMKGLFTYLDLGENLYDVSLNAPIEGYLSVYGATITQEGNIFAWNKNNTVTYSLDIAYELSLNPEFTYNRFINKRTVRCKKTDERVLYDDIYYFDILSDIGMYFDYDL